MLDDSINIRGIKRYAVDHAGYVPPEPCAKSTGKRIAIVGGGPGGLSAAYYLQRMGHQTVVYEKRKSLGGMLRYGIPNYRLPRARLDEEIEVIKAAGVEIHTGVDIGKDIAMCDLDKEFDAVYLAIGAQTDKKVGIPGEDGENVISAVTMLRKIGDDIMPDFKGKRVLVIGGGNVAMDVARSSKRLGAAYVGIAYRRRQEDMTALPQEVEGALAEGCELLPLQAPTRIELDEEQKVAALWVQPQMISSYRKGRPSPKQADTEEKRIPCDIVVVAIGQGIECDVIIPAANYADRPKCGRIQLKERQTTIRNADFEPIEYGMSSEEAQQECGRCLRCDHYGFGVFKGGRTTKW